MKIGITGGIATGKSLITKLIREQGYPVVDADLIARQVVAKGQPAYNRIINEFGTEILNDNSEINRQLLGKIIFENKDKRDRLNKITHPYIKEKILKQANEIEKEQGIVFLDIPLLYEAGYNGLVDKVIVVTVSKDIQLLRLKERDQITKDFALKKISSQLPMDEKEKLADYIIDNSSTIDNTKAQLISILERLQM